MASRTDYLPRAFAALLTWLDNFITYLEDSGVIARLGLDPARIAALKVETGAYREACKRADHPNAGHVDRLDRKARARSLSARVRQYVNAALRYNEKVTLDDRARLGLYVPDAPPAAEPLPGQYPEIEADVSVLRRVKITFFNREHRAARPAHVHGIELRFAVLAPGVTPSLDLLTESAFSTRARTKLDFTDQQRGQLLALCARYENNTGGKGPYGPVVTVFIP
jgi:hypothetical protein